MVLIVDYVRRQIQVMKDTCKTSRNSNEYNCE